MMIDPPLEIPDFLDRLYTTAQRIVPGSLIWLPHPTRAGWVVAAVRVEDDSASRPLRGDASFNLRGG